MPIRVALHHRTAYHYDRLVSLSPHVVRLRPAPHCRTKILGYSLRIGPEKFFINWQQDPYSNYLARIVVPERATKFVVDVDLIADMTVINPFDFFVEAYAEKYPFAYEPELLKELTPYLETLPVGPKLAALTESMRGEKIRMVDYLVGINQRISKEVKYLIRLEPGVQTPEETLTTGSGSCRDSAWLQVQLWRNLGIAARFVSGYLIQLKSDEKSLDGPSGPEKDFTDLHAWTEVYVPGAGWIGLDATSGLLAGEGHIPLACTATPSSAAAVSGMVDECETEMAFDMTVTRVHEDPRVTLPYTEDQWKQIEGLGHLIDERLEANDARMTMGGEPTFVSIDDMEGAEWNTAAHGVKKRELSGRLIKRLREKFAPGGLLHFGQGKWYPGESLPRWALACYWRKDGVAAWEDPHLIANDEDNFGHSETQAKAFMDALAKTLGVDPTRAEAGYEDAWYYMWKERRLPVNVDPFKSNLAKEEDRKRLAKVFEQGLEKVIGYALPLRPTGNPGAPWESGTWFFRPERMYLLPGDSPMGYRLPLDSLPWVAAGDVPYNPEMDPTVTRGPLADPRRTGQRFVPGMPEGYGSGGTGRPEGQGFREQEAGPGYVAGGPGGGDGSDGPDGSGGSGGPGVAEGLGRGQRPPLEKGREHDDDFERDTASLPAHQESAPWLIRTALCVEPRQGKLHIFLPPVIHLEDFLDLVARIEQTAATLQMPVVLEGYPPPRDHRLDHIKVTPDPGVIEVNVQPAHNWDELVKNTTTLYEEARQCRLGTEKFMLDGRHTGTGGGNHVVIGGPTPRESPLLRRPDLLKSLVAYWHNHPALSYLFSGTFIGPTSQAPRVDEGRRDMVYELEIALKQIPGKDVKNTPPWLVDRVLRNLLVDATGNTHRAEFCVDKLYSPDSSTGRLGLLEFRGFEMPPHARMSLTQQLLLRSLIASFWNKPYERPLVRWNTELHDRFLLPHFVQQDLDDVIGDLNRDGFALKSEWFAPHHEFRFPVHGTLSVGGVHVELRQAIEPWHVLGEEPGGGGTVRFVDSSVERLQIKGQGLVDSRHVISVNGVVVPLHPTGRNGEFVAGLRYRAWQPPSCLHPTIGVHTPLVFDIVDTWNERSLGGCTYHVAHPGGRSFDTFPVNAFAAESRRVARFHPYGQTPGRIMSMPAEKSREYPFTLDLRRI